MWLLVYWRIYVTRVSYYLIQLYLCLCLCTGSWQRLSRHRGQFWNWSTPITHTTDTTYIMTLWHGDALLIIDLVEIALTKWRECRELMYLLFVWKIVEYIDLWSFYDDFCTFVIFHYVDICTIYYNMFILAPRIKLMEKSRWLSSCCICLRLKRFAMPDPITRNNIFIAVHELQSWYRALPYVCNITLTFSISCDCVLFYIWEGHGHAKVSLYRSVLLMRVEMHTLLYKNVMSSLPDLTNIYWSTKWTAFKVLCNLLHHASDVYMRLNYTDIECCKLYIE